MACMRKENFLLRRETWPRWSALIAQDCLEPMKVFSYTKISELCVASFVFLTYIYPLWIVDSWVTDHTVKDRETLVEFQKIIHGVKWIYVGNNVRVVV